MILRKPYGFLIRHFKAIHLLLLLLYIYLAVKVNGILDYYNKFISNNIGKIDAIKYVNNTYLIAVVLSMVICVIVYLLMRYKKKPRLFYLVLMLLYFIVTVMVNISYGGLQTIYVSVLETKTLRLYRDLLRILIVFQYISILFVLIRAMGFDIKKFNFVQDLHELNIDVSDEEEVELTLGSTNDLQRRTYRGIRELKYYYFENSRFINVILIVVVIVFASGFFINNEVINKEYKENEEFSTDKYNFKVFSSYVTNKDYNNSVIKVDNTSFVIVKLGIGSKVGKTVFNSANLILKVNNHTYSTDVRLASKFVDLGYVYNGQTINGGISYLFIYNIKEEDINSKMKIVYAGDKIVNLSPIYLDKVSKSYDYSLNKNINFEETTFGAGHFLVSEYEAKEQFSFKYDYVVSGKTYTSDLLINSKNNAIVRLKIDSSYPRGFNNYSVLSKYGKLKYKIGNTEYTSSVFSDKTPGTYKEGLYLAVDKNVVTADRVWLELVIRNKQYNYYLK